MPRLRDRRDDIPPLVDHFIRKYAKREEKPIAGISSEAMGLLLRYAFPGNIRELENIVERAVVFSEGQDIVSADLPVFLSEPPEEDEESGGLSLSEKVRLLESKEIRRALRENGGVKSRAARSLGVTERILSYKIRTYGLDERA